MKTSLSRCWRNWKIKNRKWKTKNFSFLLSIFSISVFDMNRSILYVQYTNPANYPPLEHSGLILLKAGWDVRYFGIQSEGESSKLVFPETLAQRVTLWKRSAPGIRQKPHFAAFTLTALWRALWQRPAWVYCSDSMSCPAAWLIGRFTRCKVLYHEHDSPSEPNAKSRKQKAEREKAESAEETRHLTPALSPAGAERGRESDFSFQLSKFQRLLMWSRQRVGREADLVVLPNEKRLELFVQTTGRQKTSLCVYNCPCKEEVIVQNREPKAQGKLRLVFHGSINQNRLPLAMLEAMSRFPGRVHLSVAGYETMGIKGYMAAFLQTAERLGLGNAVEFVGALPRHEIFEPASKCHVGLAFVPLQGGDVNMANMTGASNKPFDYLACGLALLVSARPDWEETFVRPGYGLACNPNDADSIAAQLRWFLDHPVETREMGGRGRQRILAEWNYEKQFAPLLKVFNDSSPV
jgi:glycosyltransferase involved in cell wall biosynthesis